MKSARKKSSLILGLEFTKIVPRSEVESTITKAQTIEFPGSELAADVTEIPRSSFEITTFQQGKVNVHFEVVPRAPQISEKDFSKLEQAITEKDLSLEDIRNFSTSQR